MDEDVVFAPDGTFRAMSLCAFDIEENDWSIWWYDGRSPRRLEPPLRGRFERGIGVFVGAARTDGDSMLTRYLWRHHEEAPRFEQAFSTNNGHTWETTWTMEFRRIS